MAELGIQNRPLLDPGPVESIVEINKELLDSSNHSVVTFKGKNRLNIAKSIEAGISVGRDEGIPISKVRVSRTKGDNVRNNGAISKIICERKGILKILRV
ncbi:hypothetical protein E1A91_D08G088600v1 [Gossypium mustelinum]|uniref:Uncharacterized protein n=1 Tax=Gossypium mustelinum TaxID=34275 RepID=A0A5D2TTJ0_GOSMU|nr:hypothetical protein E1A91_D08G088600v1 [Gossypium mustelinum]